MVHSLLLFVISAASFARQTSLQPNNANLLFGLSDMAAFLPTLAELVARSAPDEAVDEAIVQWCADVLDRHRLADVDRLLKFLHREIHFSDRPTQPAWVESYRFISSRIVGLVEMGFGNGLVVRDFQV